MSVAKGIFHRRPSLPETFDYHSGVQSPTPWKSDEQIDHYVPTHCCYCGVQCGMYLKVAGGKVVGVEPRADFPLNHGMLCPKGATAYQTVNHPDRLTYPLMRRNGKDSPLERASWDEVLDTVVTRFRAIQEEHGKDAVAVYSGSSMTNEKCYLMGKFARVALGTRHTDYNGRLCMSSATGANERSLGIDRAANPISDMLHADCIFVIGANVGECFPIVTSYLWQARDRGCKLIVADPRQTPIARTADLFLPLRSGTDSALLGGMLHVIIKEGLIDEAFIHERTVGWEETKALAERYPPERVAKVCGLHPEAIIEAARLYGRARAALLYTARGLEHQSKGVDNGVAAANLALSTGNFGRPGAGYGTLTGQGNGQGGHEMGQKASQLPGCREIENPEDRAYICSVWGIVCPTQAIFYGTYEEWVEAGRARQGAKPVNTFFFGKQRVRTRNYVIMREQDAELDLMALVEEWRKECPYPWDEDEVVTRRDTLRFLLAGSGALFLATGVLAREDGVIYAVKEVAR